MTGGPRRPRVLYPLSTDLIAASDALPSNVGRSSMIHSLIYSLGLLNLPSASESDHDESSKDNEQDQEEDEDERLKLTRVLLGSDSSDGNGEMDAFTKTPSIELEKAEIIVPQPASRAQLEAYHSKAYLDVLEEHTLPAEEEAFGLVDDCYRFPALPSHIEQVAGASIAAARALASDEADIAICWDGGRHHAHKSRAAGFCYVNDVVLAILELRKARKVIVEVAEDEQRPAIASTSTSPTKTSIGFGARPEDIRRHLEQQQQEDRRQKRLSDSDKGPTSRKRRTQLQRLNRILYLDLDLHWGDGVEEAFTSSPSVVTVSMHCQAPGFYPASDKDLDDESADPHSIQIPLAPGLNSQDWTRIWQSTVLPIIQSYAPEALVVQLGLDTLVEDPMKQWRLDLSSILKAVQDLLDYIDQQQQESKERKKRIKLLLLGGGGYNAANTARGWAATTALVLGRLDLEENQGHPQDGKVDSAVNTSGFEAVEKQEDGKVPASVQEEQPALAALLPTSTSAHKLTLSSAIPLHPFWPSYGPSFTLDVGGDSVSLSDSIKPSPAAEEPSASHDGEDDEEEEPELDRIERLGKGWAARLKAVK